MPIAVTISYTITDIESFNDGTTNVTYTMSHETVDLVRTRTDQLFTEQLADNYDPDGEAEANVAVILGNFERLTARYMTSYANAVRRQIEQTAVAGIAPSSETEVSGLSLVINRQRTKPFDFHILPHH